VAAESGGLAPDAPFAPEESAAAAIADEVVPF
jgi:hypothetical protein